MRSLQTHFAEEGMNWERELRQIAKERDTMKELNLALDEVASEKKENPNNL